MKKYFIAVILLSGLMQGESEAVEIDILLIVKEIKIISSKYLNCVEIQDDKKRLLCFDGLTAYLNEREKNMKTFQTWEHLKMTTLINTKKNFE